MKKYGVLAALLVVAAIGAFVVFRYGGNTYDGDSYSVTYPENWQVMHFQPVDVAFLAPQGPQDKGFRPNINIVVTPNDGDISAQGALLGTIVAGLKRPDNDFALLDKEEMWLHGRKCLYLRYSMTSGGNTLQGAMGIIGADKAYIFSYTAMAGDFETYLPEFKAMLASFAPEAD